MRKLVLVLMLVAAVAVPVTAAAADGPPFPVGVCVRSTLVQPKPLCVLIDPTQ